MQNRRDFIRGGALTGASLLVGCRHQVVKDLDPIIDTAEQDPAAAASDEPFWQSIRAAFDLEEGIINLQHGVSPATQDAHEALERESRSVNRAPTYHMRDWPAQGRREEVRVAAADALGCDPEELAITRSGTESLEIAQLGIDLMRGDEVLSTCEDYWSMWDAWQQRVVREGIVLREIDLGAPYPPAAPGRVHRGAERRGRLDRDGSGHRLRLPHGCVRRRLPRAQDSRGNPAARRRRVLFARAPFGPPDSFLFHEPPGSRLGED